MTRNIESKSSKYFKDNDHILPSQLFFLSFYTYSWVSKDSLGKTSKGSFEILLLLNFLSNLKRGGKKRDEH